MVMLHQVGHPHCATFASVFLAQLQEHVRMDPNWWCVSCPATPRTLLLA